MLQQRLTTRLASDTPAANPIYTDGLLSPTIRQTIRPTQPIAKPAHTVKLILALPHLQGELLSLRRPWHKPP